MPRTIYIIAPDPQLPPDAPPEDHIDQADIQAADQAGATEIVVDVPPRLRDRYPNPAYPFVHVEQDDPEAPALRLAAAVLRNTFNTTRTATQINNCLDAITLILRRVAITEMERR